MITICAYQRERPSYRSRLGANLCCHEVMLDVAVIAATLLGPVLAVQIQKYLERWREENDRRHRIFKVLMATRAAPLAANHIEALNLIDIDLSWTAFSLVPMKVLMRSDCLMALKNSSICQRSR